MPDHPSDPRPDKVSDHKHWKDVLHNAWHADQDLYGVLHGVRCGGAKIALTETSFMLLPDEWEQGQWDDIKRKYLMPHQKKIVEVFKMSRLGRIGEPPERIFDKGDNVSDKR